MATIKEIAKAAGVSRGTIDRVINNRPGVNEETEKKVREIVTKLEYEPNLAGKMLAARKKKIRLGFIVCDTPMALFFRDVYLAAQKKAKELEPYGVTVLFYLMKELTDPYLEELLRQVEDDELDGIAISPLRIPAITEFVRTIEARKIPMVFFNVDNEEIQRMCYVGCDYKKSGQAAAGLMAMCTDEKGKLGIATVFDAKSPSFYERIEAFRNEIKKMYPKMEILNWNGNYIFQENDYSAIIDFIEQHPEIDGLYIVNPGDCVICQKVKNLAKEKKIKIITNDVLKEQRQMIKKGIIDATIGQQPELQGSLPLQILSDYLMLGKGTKKDKIYTELTIYIRQNL